MTEPKPPKIEFPCPNYPIKVLGVGIEGYDQLVIDIVRMHAPDFDVDRILVRDSKNGRFRALTLYITATGIDQLQSIHRDLTASEHIHMVI